MLANVLGQLAPYLKLGQRFNKLKKYWDDTELTTQVATLNERIEDFLIVFAEKRWHNS